MTNPANALHNWSQVPSIFLFALISTDLLEFRNQVDVTTESSADEVHELNEQLVILRAQYEELEKVNEQYREEKENSTNRVDAEVGTDEDIAANDAAVKVSEISAMTCSSWLFLI